MVPTWASPADAPSRSKVIESWYASLPRLPSTPTAVLASAPALSELDLLREPLSVAALRAGEDVRKLESPGAFSCSEMKPAYAESETSQVTHVGEGSSTPSNVRQLSRDSVKNDRRGCKLLPQVMLACNDPIFIAPSWFSAPPGLTVPTGAGPDYRRNEL